jgi:histidinol-phosphate aminotransferase
VDHRSPATPAPSPPIPVPPRPEVAEISPYVPGRRPQGDQVNALRLASNENPLGPSPRAVAAARAALEGVHRYPDPRAGELRAAIARHHGLAADRVLVGNGSDEVLHLLAGVFLDRGRRAVVAGPPYGLHRIVARWAGAEVVEVPLRDFRHDLEAMVAASRPGDWIVVTNPHNPTGTAVSPTALRDLVLALPPGRLLLVDEAYVHFLDPEWQPNLVELLSRQPALVICRTFSKAYGLAGLRIGYALADPAIVELVERVRPPFNVGSAAQAAAAAALEDEGHVARSVALVREGRQRLLADCRRLGLEAIPSQANFVLVRDEVGWASRLAEEGIFVRPGSTLGIPGWARVTVGTSEEMDRLVAALARVAIRAS